MSARFKPHGRPTTGRYGALPGLDSHLTPEDEDERTDEERQRDEDAREANEISRYEDRQYDQ